jgi:thioredoxin 1
MSGSNDEEIEAIKQRKMAELQKALASNTAMSSIKEPITLTNSNFKNEVSKYPILLIDFWAPWCGPCRMISPMIEQLAREYTGKLYLER